MKKPRKCDIVELAVWLHDTAMKHPYYADYRCEDVSFPTLSVDKQAVYKFIAEQLLTNPPVFMKEYR